MFPSVRSMLVGAPAIGLRGLLAAVVLGTLVACGGAAQSFDPTGPCTTDGAAPGAYPELERLVPTAYEERGPDRLDSGRNCSSANLGPLEARGIDEVRFAGGTWDFGSDIAVVLAVFRAEGLTPEAMAEWWKTTAQDAGRTEIIGESRPALDGGLGYRLDTKTGERLQTVVVWQSPEPDTVNVVLSHNLPDPKIQAGIDAFDRD